MAAACLAVVLVGAVSGPADALLIDYITSTGQTASADFTFDSPTTPLLSSGAALGYHLQIILKETTPAAASSLTGAAAVLTSIGFLLPDQSVITGGRAMIAAGSASVGFSLGDIGAGFDVSGEWGATLNGEKPLDKGVYDFVSANATNVTAFNRVNRDGNLTLDGPQGGLLDDVASRGGLGVIDNSIVIQLRLDANPATTTTVDLLTSTQKTAFLTTLRGNSLVEFGTTTAYGYAVVPQPGALALLALGVVTLAFLRPRRMSVVGDPR